MISSFLACDAIQFPGTVCRRSRNDVVISTDSHHSREEMRSTRRSHIVRRFITFKYLSIGAGISDETLKYPSAIPECPLEQHVHPTC
jgi:hypothetical protein